jgi:RHS repeat-associated protein
VQRTFDPYGQLATESVNGGMVAYGANQTWDAGGRRLALNVGGASYGYAWQADGSLTGASNPTASGSYIYNTAGILTSRSAGGRVTSITSLDGEGRPLAITNTVNTQGLLGETLAWSGDGLLTNHTLIRGDGMTDNRLYSYANLSRRLTQEQLNLTPSTTWTNEFVYDRGVPGGSGTLTTAGPTNSSFGLWWSGIPDAFSRVNTETNNSIGFLAYGFVNGQSTLSALLDNQAIQILDVGTNNMQWRTFLELSQGAHQLTVNALHPSGFYTASATNSFTNSIPNQTTFDSFDGGGNITNRVFHNNSGNGAINRTQALSYDAKNRLRQVIEINTNNYGFLWSATYDGLDRRLTTTTILISNGVPSTVPPQVLSSYYDPQVEFLELGVLLTAAPEQEFLQPGTSPSVPPVWKLYGPDLDGTYGDLNGIGGLEGVSQYQNTFNPVISDARGNVLAEITNGVPHWILARPTAYGAVPGHRPVAYGNGVDYVQSCAWRGRAVDVPGTYHIGYRDLETDSGQWSSRDPRWNDRDPNGQSYCGGEPVMGVDPDGLCVEAEAAYLYTGGRTGQDLRDLGNYLNDYNNTSSGWGRVTAAAGTLVNEAAGMSAPATYVNGLASYGHNVSTVNQDSGFLIASSYAVLGWNVGGIVSGVANEDLVTGQPVGDWYDRGTAISSGVANTAGVAAGGVWGVGKLGLVSKTTATIVAAEETGTFSRLAQPGGLTGSENAGGHLLARHVSLTDADLAARLSSQSGITTASTFATRAEAEAAVARALDVNAAKVSTWTGAGANGRLVLNAPFSGGSVLQRGAAAAIRATGVRVVLQGNGSGGYYILTGFPTP